MPPIDWEWSPYKNPFGEDTPSKALARKWRHLILFDGGWAKAYAFTVLCMLYVIGISVWWVIDDMQVEWSRYNALHWRFVSIILPLFFVVRINLASVPALTVCRNTKTSLWEHFRITTVSGDDVARAMLVHAFNYGVLPLAFVSTLETVAYLYLIGSDTGTIEPLIRAPIMFLIFLGLGLIMTAFGLIGALIWRHALGVVMGVAGPLIFLAVIAGGTSLYSFIQTLWVRYPYGIEKNIATLLLAPENRIAGTKFILTQGGSPIFYATDPMAMLGMVWTLVIPASILWIALWLVLRHRLRFG